MHLIYRSSLLICKDVGAQPEKSEEELNLESVRKIVLEMCQIVHLDRGTQLTQHVFGILSLLLRIEIRINNFSSKEYVCFAYRFLRGFFHFADKPLVNPWRTMAICQT